MLTGASRRRAGVAVLGLALVSALGAPASVSAQEAAPEAASRLAAAEPRYFEVGAFMQPSAAVELWAALTKQGVMADLLLDEQVTRVIVGPQCTAQDTAAVETALVRLGFSTTLTTKPERWRTPACPTPVPLAVARVLDPSQGPAQSDLRGAVVARPLGRQPARAGVWFPGYFGTRAAHASPVEQHNLLSVTSIEQGVAVWNAGSHAVVPYASVRIGMDQQGLDWNNKTVAQAGVKYVRAFSHGVVQLGAGYAYERRRASDFRASQPIAFGNYWVGWHPFEPGRRSFPGSSWAAVGNDVPAEGSNVIATFYVEQGFVAASFGRLGIIPFVDLTIGADSARYSWNNVRMLGEGLRVALPIPGGTIEAGAVYRQEQRWRDGSSAQGLGGFANLRYGWSLSAPTRR